MSNDLAEIVRALRAIDTTLFLIWLALIGGVVQRGCAP